MKTYKDLSLEQELEYTLWLSFFEQSIDNALVQIKRWNKSKKGWDLEMFFMAVSCIDDSVVAINKFLNFGKDFVNEPELNNALKEFRKKIKNHHIKDIRNDLIHRERLSKQQDKKSNSLPKRSILVLDPFLGSGTTAVVAKALGRNWVGIEKEKKYVQHYFYS